MYGLNDDIREYQREQEENRQLLLKILEIAKNNKLSAEERLVSIIVNVADAIIKMD